MSRLIHTKEQRSFFLQKDIFNYVKKMFFYVKKQEANFNYVTHLIVPILKDSFVILVEVSLQAA